MVQLKMKLRDFFINKEEMIEWDRFVGILEQNSIPVVRNDLIVSSPYDFPYEKVFIGGGDWEVNSSNFVTRDELKLMIATNLNMEATEKIEAMPIGVPSFSHDPIIGNIDKIVQKNSEDKAIRNMCYMGFRDSTFHTERSHVRNKFGGLSWCTASSYDRTETGYSNYLDCIYNHNFVLCPRGNGIDTHRIWETLYLRSIPIVKKCTAMSYFNELPILWINDWNEISLEFLQRNYELIHSKEYNMEKTTISYYVKKLIQN
jgi:hypothetical protein